MTAWRRFWDAVTGEGAIWWAKSPPQDKGGYEPSPPSGARPDSEPENLTTTTIHPAESGSYKWWVNMSPWDPLVPFDHVKAEEQERHNRAERHRVLYEAQQERRGQWRKRNGWASGLTL